MKNKALKVPPREQWSTTWSPRQERLIHSIALGNLQSGYPDMLSAWRAAESHFGNRENLLEAREHGNASSESE